jgi:hypothetical protein
VAVPRGDSPVLVRGDASARQPGGSNRDVRSVDRKDLECFAQSCESAARSAAFVFGFVAPEDAWVLGKDVRADGPAWRERWRGRHARTSGPARTGARRAARRRQCSSRGRERGHPRACPASRTGWVAPNIARRGRPRHPWCSLRRQGGLGHVAGCCAHGGARGRGDARGACIATSLPAEEDGLDAAEEEGRRGHALARRRRENPPRLPRPTRKAT